MSTHNICFRGEIRKNVDIILLGRPCLEHCQTIAIMEFPGGLNNSTIYSTGRAYFRL